MPLLIGPVGDELLLGFVRFGFDDLELAVPLVTHLGFPPRDVLHQLSQLEVEGGAGVSQAGVQIEGEEGALEGAAGLWVMV